MLERIKKRNTIYNQNSNNNMKIVTTKAIIPLYNSYRGNKQKLQPESVTVINMYYYANH